MLVLGLSGNLSREDTDLVPFMSRRSFHDAAACLIRDGEVIAAAEEASSVLEVYPRSRGARPG
jgi:decarbamoylnovobiocin carbamoyltransferase/7-O-carbamoyltransferase